MKKSYISLLLLLICSNLIRSQCNPTLVNSVSSGCAPLEVFFVFPAHNSGTVTWSLDSTDSFGPAFSHTFNLPGVYTLTLTIAAPNATGVCIGTATTAITVVTGPSNGCANTVVAGLKEDFNENGFLVYPNPGNGIFEVQLNEELINAGLILFNALGQKVYADKLDRGSNTVHCAYLSSGVYSLCLFQNGVRLNTRKLIIE